MRLISGRFGGIVRWIAGLVRSRLDDGETWCLVGNVGGVREEGKPDDPSWSTKHFSFGTKAWCLPSVWGDGCERIVAIGKHRGTSRMTKVVMPAKRITNWRVRSVHDPTVIRMLEEGHLGVSPRWTKREAEARATYLRGLEAERGHGPKGDAGAPDRRHVPPNDSAGRGTAPPLQPSHPGADTPDVP